MPLGINVVFGKQVILQRITTTRGNSRGDPTETIDEQITIQAEIQAMSGNENIVRQGILIVGDAKGFFKPEDQIEDGDIIIYQQKPNGVQQKYRVTSLVKKQLGTAELFHQCNLKRIQE